MSASVTIAVLLLLNIQVFNFTTAVVYTSGKKLVSICPFSSNGATPLGCPFSDCRTKSGASAFSDK
jgi:hypothetical protein